MFVASLLKDDSIPMHNAYALQARRLAVIYVSLMFLPFGSLALLCIFQVLTPEALPPLALRPRTWHRRASPPSPLPLLLWPLPA